MKKYFIRTTVATTAVLALAGCSTSDDGADNADGSASGSGSGADSHGPITFAMGKNDTDKITPIIDKLSLIHI